MSNMKKQYEQIKKQYPEHLLGFKLGEFYEFYYDDAKIVASVLDLVLTERDNGSDERVPMVGFPIKCEMAYAGRLLNAGHKVFLTQTDVEEINEGALQLVSTPTNHHSGQVYCLETRIVKEK